MREIKFRCWSYMYSKDFGEQMLGVDNINTDNYVASCYIKKGDYIPVHYYGKYKNGELMQFTGLKDKNGKEIYEGDLFEITYSNCPDGFKIMGKETTYKKAIGVVESSDSGYLLKHIHPETKETVYGILHKILERNPKEIIGNIYENPELLPT